MDDDDLFKSLRIGLWHHERGGPPVFAFADSASHRAWWADGCAGRRPEDAYCWMWHPRIADDRIRWDHLATEPPGSRWAISPALEARIAAALPQTIHDLPQTTDTAA